MRWTDRTRHSESWRNPPRDGRIDSRKTARHYAKAPVTEALVEIRVRLPEKVSVADLLRCHAGEEQTYPHKQELRVAQGQFQVGERLSTSASPQQVGFLFTSSDQKQIYQAR